MKLTARTVLDAIEANCPAATVTAEAEPYGAGIYVHVTPASAMPKRKATQMLKEVATALEAVGFCCARFGSSRVIVRRFP